MMELKLAMDAADSDPVDYLLNHRPVEAIRDDLAALQASLEKKP